MNASNREADLSLGHLYGRAWRAFRREWKAAIAVMLLLALISNLGAFTAVQWDNAILAIIQPALYAGAAMFYLGVVRGGRPAIGELFAGFRDARIFIKAFCVYYLLTIMIVIGLLLLIVPGIYMMVAFIPAMYLVLDEKLGIVDTLNRAWDLTEERRGRVFLVLLSLIPLNIAGALVVLVGLLVSFTLSSLIMAQLYEELKASSLLEDVDDEWKDSAEGEDTEPAL